MMQASLMACLLVVGQVITTDKIPMNNVEHIHQAGVNGEGANDADADAVKELLLRWDKAMRARKHESAAACFDSTVSPYDDFNKVTRADIVGILESSFRVADPAAMQIKDVSINFAGKRSAKVEFHLDHAGGWRMRMDLTKGDDGWLITGQRKSMDVMTERKLEVNAGLKLEIPRVERSGDEVTVRVKIYRAHGKEDMRGLALKTAVPLETYFDHAIGETLPDVVPEKGTTLNPEFAWLVHPIELPIEFSYMLKVTEGNPTHVGHYLEYRTGGREIRTDWVTAEIH